MIGKLVPQEEGMGCGIACVASALGISYQEARQLSDRPEGSYTTGYNCKDLVKALNKKGRNYTFKKFKVEHTTLMEKTGTIVFVKEGEDDLWGGAWTPEQINNFYFGLALQAQNIPLNGFAGNAYVDHAKLTVYTTPLSDRSVNVQLEVAAASDFYLPREIYGSLCNIISLGQRDADDVDDC